MIVTDIKEFKKDRYEIFIDEEFAFVLYKGELKSYNIKLNSEIAIQTYDEITKELLPKRATKRAMNLLLGHMYTKKGLGDKLSESKYPPHAINTAIEYVESFHYLDDVEYARQYIMGRISTKSKLVLRQYLLNKGVAEADFEIAYDEVVSDSGDCEGEVINKLIIKKLSKRISLIIKKITGCALIER